MKHRRAEHWTALLSFSCESKPSKTKLRKVTLPWRTPRSSLAQVRAAAPVVARAPRTPALRGRRVQLRHSRGSKSMRSALSSCGCAALPAPLLLSLAHPASSRADSSLAPSSPHRCSAAPPLCSAAAPVVRASRADLALILRGRRAAALVAAPLLLTTCTSSIQPGFPHITRPVPPFGFLLTRTSREAWIM